MVELVDIVVLIFEIVGSTRDRPFSMYIFIFIDLKIFFILFRLW